MKRVTKKPVLGLTTSKNSSRSDSGSSSTTKKRSEEWRSTGKCGNCLEPIGFRLAETEVRHIETGVLYGQCRQALNPPERSALGKEVVPDSVMLEAQRFNERHRAILDMYDPRDCNLWERHPGSDGNKGWREFIPMKGLK